MRYLQASTRLSYKIGDEFPSWTHPVLPSLCMFVIFVVISATPTEPARDGQRKVEKVRPRQDQIQRVIEKRVEAEDGRDEMPAAAAAAVRAIARATVLPAKMNRGGEKGDGLTLRTTTTTQA